MALRAACDPVAMPLMVEPLVFKPGTGGYGVDGDPERIVPLVRQAAELGADVIKADPTDDVAEYHRVVEAAGGRPVLVRGGGRVSDEEILRRTEALMGQGAAGIVYGRNVIQHADPAGMVRALMDVVHAR
jgi:DhnA family fructose-bisphosphate aldolase class Ia